MSSRQATQRLATVLSHVAPPLPSGRSLSTSSTAQQGKAKAHIHWSLDPTADPKKVPKAPKKDMSHLPYPVDYLARCHGKNYTKKIVEFLVRKGPPRFKRGGCSRHNIARFFPPVKDVAFGARVLDLSNGVEAAGVIEGEIAVGKWNEKRSNMYGALKHSSEERNIHVGVDLCGPVGTTVHAFDNGKIFLVGNNPSTHDYGYTIITKHNVDGYQIYALHGHLSAKSIEGKKPGQRVTKGQVIGWLGDRKENGDWFPHCHFQLSLLEPIIPDMPGVVAEAHREIGTAVYINPEQILGPLVLER